MVSPVPRDSLGSLWDGKGLHYCVCVIVPLVAMLLASLPKATSCPWPFLLFPRIITTEAWEFRLRLSDLLPPAWPSPQRAPPLSPSVTSRRFEDGARLPSTSSVTLPCLSEVLPGNPGFLSALPLATVRKKRRRQAAFGERWQGRGHVRGGPSACPHLRLAQDTGRDCTAFVWASLLGAACLPGLWAAARTASNTSCRPVSPPFPPSPCLRPAGSPPLPSARPPPPPAQLGLGATSPRSNGDNTHTNA